MISTTVAAQTPSLPPIDNNKTAALQRLGPAMGSRYSGQVSSTVSAWAQPETAQNLAIFTKNYYDALLAQGFTRADALRIVTSTRIPNFNEN